MRERYILDEKVKQRIEANSRKDPETGCWVWQKFLDVYGYGKIGIKRTERKTHGNPDWDVLGAHKVSYWIHKGDIPSGMVIRHTCHNPACVNPDHLLIGTPKENTQDSVKAGRMLGTKPADTSNYSKMATGRFRVYKPDGSWTWGYPNESVLVKNQPFDYKKHAKRR